MEEEFGETGAFFFVSWVLSLVRILVLGVSMAVTTMSMGVVVRRGSVCEVEVYARREF